MQLKLDHLKQILKEMQSVVIAFSGGVDSTFLLHVAYQVLGDKVLAVTARSETYPEREYKEAVQYIEAMGIQHITIETSELGIPNFSDNPADRCYYCKTELFSKLKKIANEHHIQTVADGSNVDDLGDYRPGSKAKCELEIHSPLQEAGLTKDEIRTFSQEMGLKTWDKPAYACLASRFPYGTQITDEKLKMVDSAENFLINAGFKGVRVRYHDHMARIEVPSETIEKITKPDFRTRLVLKLKELGFQYVSLDLEGYRQGSMNEVLDD